MLRSAVRKTLYNHLRSSSRWQGPMLFEFVQQVSTTKAILYINLCTTVYVNTIFKTVAREVSPTEYCS